MSNLDDIHNKFSEAFRLINKFFPETKGIFSIENGINIGNFISSMELFNLKVDVSCAPLESHQNQI